jgi:hypothetical protein
LQRIEVCAFGCLLEELLERCDVPPSGQAIVRTLYALQQRCMQSQYQERPMFKEILEELGVLVA